MPLGSGKKIPPRRFGGGRLRGNDSALSASFHGPPFYRRQKPVARVSFDPATRARTLSFDTVIPHKFRNYTPEVRLHVEMAQIFTVDPVATVILKYGHSRFFRQFERPDMSDGTENVWPFPRWSEIRRCYAACKSRIIEMIINLYYPVLNQNRLSGSFRFRRLNSDLKGSI